MLAAVDALNPNASAIPEAMQVARKAAFRAMAGAIVAEITGHAAVTVSATVAEGIRVATTGTAAAQSGATTTTGTATTTTGTIA